jgi:hypothetical protein
VRTGESSWDNPSPLSASICNINIEDHRCELPATVPREKKKRLERFPVSEAPTSAAPEHAAGETPTSAARSRRRR